MDFSWLNELPDERWQSDSNGVRYIPIAVSSFRSMCEVPDEEARLFEAFDAWGARQPRQYGALAVPGNPGEPYIWVTAILDRSNAT